MEDKIEKIENIKTKIKNLQENIVELENELRTLTNDLPTCSVCHTYKNLRISTKEDEDLNDENDSYINAPFEGDFYCGCLDYLKPKFTA